ncbi:ATP-grasp fold amidoligase family protein [Shewanella indica]|uniref:ATP-grasp fold amidoligase family protein n=1 Tax=Shewanella indica TaxID=768528 RepID=UPI000C342ABD|nr:ATP-grasp fold amidoligase family protein [Shewanella indica]GHB22063.1 glycosyl transferase [Shewanella indica]
MNRRLKNIIRDISRYILSPKGYTFFRFIITHRYIPNFKCPRSFSEKIIHRKFNDDPKKYSKLVDKYTVRELVSEKVGGEYLIPLIKEVTKLSISDFNDLPSEFVMKTSNGGGGENVEVITDLNAFDKSELTNRFNQYLTVNVGNIVDEHFYDIESPKIVFEKLLKHSDGRLPSDYKFHVFKKNNLKKIIIQIDEGRFTTHKRSLFDRQLRMLDFDIQPKYSKVSTDYEWPENMDEMFDVAEKLSSDFPYVRIDLYNVDGKIYFGEFTFCHGSGWEPFSSKHADFLLGSYWGE